MKMALVGVAGAVGAMSRYGIGITIGTRSFPWATLSINLAGSFLLGLLVATGSARDWDSMATVPLTVGFVGGFTTFSTFCYEAFDLLRTDRPGAAAAYITISTIGGTAAAALGYLTGRRFA